MTDLNEVIIEGRLVHDAEAGMKLSQDGQTAYGTFTIAVNKSKKENGEWVDYASFFDVKGFGKTYQNAVPKMTKGSQVTVVGSLEQEKWTSKDGQNKSKVVVLANRIISRSKPSNGQSAQQAPAQSKSEEFQEDFPF